MAQSSKITNKTAVLTICKFLPHDKCCVKLQLKPHTISTLAKLENQITGGNREVGGFL